MIDGLSPLFEGIIVMVEMFTIHIFLSGFSPKGKRAGTGKIIAYAIFGIVLGLGSIFYPNLILLPFITFAGVICLSYYCYMNSGPFAVFTSIIYLMAVVLVESMVSLLYAKQLGIPLDDIRVFGMARMLSTVTAKLVILFLIRIVLIVLEKHRNIIRYRTQMSVPLILCQAVLIAVIAIRFIGVYTRNEPLGYGAIMEIGSVFVVDIVILWYYDQLADMFELRFRNDIMTLQLENQARHYAKVKASLDAAAAMEHDRQKHIKLIRELEKTGHSGEALDYIASYMEEVGRETDARLVMTPHPAVSVILSDCRQRGEDAGVKCAFHIFLSGDIGIDQVDLNIILGNTIDNALEALEDVPEDQRRLDILLRQSEYYLYYEIKNTCKMPARQKRSERSGRHGYGLNNAQASVEKYGGDFHTASQAGEYIVTALIPLP
ncbi:MAG: GHKL domain-containing protein [Clostridiales bacterium]|nr:GHKL domain-containing protein [Clostridiales bacterium]